jgi:hypothetical protein
VKRIVSGHVGLFPHHFPAVLKPAGKWILRPKRVIRGAHVGGVTDVAGEL